MLISYKTGKEIVMMTPAERRDRRTQLILTVLKEWTLSARQIGEQVVKKFGAHEAIPQYDIYSIVRELETLGKVRSRIERLGKPRGRIYMLIRKDGHILPRMSEGEPSHRSLTRRLRRSKVAA